MFCLVSVCMHYRVVLVVTPALCKTIKSVSFTVEEEVLNKAQGLVFVS